MMTAPVKNCIACGREYSKSQNESKPSWNNRHKYCSHTCSGKSDKNVKRMKTLRIGLPPWNKGISCSEEKKAKISAKLMGRSLSMETRIKMRGRTPWNWAGGKTNERHKFQQTVEYKSWRKQVFQRDSYKCIECGENNHTLQADHIKPFALFPGLRLEISNGRTLCAECHKKTDTYGYRTAKIAYAMGLVSVIN